ncbi:hypothetical protein D9M68_608270 [compost metagenome]
MQVACKKDAPTPYASINVINAAIDAGTIKVNYFGKPINWAKYTGTIGNVPFANNQVFTLFNLNNDYPFTIVSATDTSKMVFSQQLALDPTGIYTLFATGQSPNYDAVFLTETNIPYNLPDSAIAVRIINLSPNSPTINVTLASTPAINEAAGLSFKQVSDFKNYPVLKSIPTGSVSFQIRDAATNALLTTYTIPATAVAPYSTVSTSLSRFKSLTLVIKGLAGTTSGVNAYSVFPVAQY